MDGTTIGNWVYWYVTPVQINLTKFSHDFMKLSLSKNYIYYFVLVYLLRFNVCLPSSHSPSGKQVTNQR